MTFRLMMAVMAVLIFGACPAPAAAQDEPAAEVMQEALPPGATEYLQPLRNVNFYDQSEQKLSFLEKCYNFYERIVAPNWKGAAVLLALSALFSSINFYTILPDSSQRLKKGYKYLFLWISVNYIFALILLFIILPDDVSMTQMDKTFFLYCLIATAFPEISTNVRLQIGKSEQHALDLQKYKKTFSNIIGREMQKAYSLDKKRRLECLKAYYADKPDLRDKLELMALQADVSEEIRKRILDKISNGDPDNNKTLINMIMSVPRMSDQLLDYFQDDIEKFRNWPEYRLMNDLQPDVTDQESARLVERGITNPSMFILNTLIGFQRGRLAQKIGVTRERIDRIAYSTRSMLLDRGLHLVKMTAVVLAICIAIFFLFSKQSIRKSEFTPRVIEGAALPESPAADSGDL